MNSVGFVYFEWAYAKFRRLFTKSLTIILLPAEPGVAHYQMYIAHNAKAYYIRPWVWYTFNDTLLSSSQLNVLKCRIELHTIYIYTSSDSYWNYIFRSYTKKNLCINQTHMYIHIMSKALLFTRWTRVHTNHTHINVYIVLFMFYCAASSKCKYIYIYIYIYMQFAQTDYHIPLITRVWCMMCLTVSVLPTFVAYVLLKCKLHMWTVWAAYTMWW